MCIRDSLGEVVQQDGQHRDQPQVKETPLPRGDAGRPFPLSLIHISDMPYYLKHRTAPKMTLVPDGTFPVCIGEKGLCEGDIISRPIDNSPIVAVSYTHLDVYKRQGALWSRHNSVKAFHCFWGCAINILPPGPFVKTHFCGSGRQPSIHSARFSI